MSGSGVQWQRVNSSEGTLSREDTPPGGPVGPGAATFHTSDSGDALLSTRQDTPPSALAAGATFHTSNSGDALLPQREDTPPSVLAAPPGTFHTSDSGAALLEHPEVKLGNGMAGAAPAPYRKPLSQVMSSPAPTAKGLTSTLALAISAAALGSSWQFGYNIGVVNAPKTIVQQFINGTHHERTGGSLDKDTLDDIYSFAVSIFCIGGMIGGLSSGFWSKRFGRKTTLLANNSLAILGGALMAFSHLAKSYEMIIAGRFVIGLNAGINSGVAPMYLSEISPVNLRGAVGSIHQLVVTISILVSQILGLGTILNNEDGWPILFGLTIVPAFYQIITLPFCPESPRYLLVDKEQEGRAQKALIHLRKTSEVYDELDEMKVEHQRELSAPRIQPWNLLTRADLRAPLGIVAVTMIAQQLSGINAVMYYSTDVFESSGLKGDNAVYATIAMGSINVLMTVVSVALVERAGRRTLLLVGYAIMWLTTILLTVTMITSSMYTWMSYVCVVMVILFVIGFATGPGSIPWFLPNELFTMGARPAAVSVSVLANWSANYVVGQVFLQLKGSLNHYVFLVFTGLLSVFWIFTYKFLPETKNKTVEEITSKWRKEGDVKSGAPAAAAAVCNGDNTKV